MNTSLFRSQLKSYAIKMGADLVGIASTSQFAEAPKGHSPADLMPNARSVIVLAQRLPRGAFNTHLLTALTLVHQDAMKRLDHIAYKVACFLEDQGGEAIPIPADAPYTDWDESNLHGMGELSHRHAAVAAGLGRLGKNSLLITPEYGNRVNLVSIVTDLEIEPDPPVTSNLCPQGCRLCIDSCPAGALPGDHTVVQKLCRPILNTKLPRGFTVLGCRACRQICPAGGKTNAAAC